MLFRSMYVQNKADGSDPHLQDVLSPEEWEKIAEYITNDPGEQDDIMVGYRGKRDIGVGWTEAEMYYTQQQHEQLMQNLELKLGLTTGMGDILLGMLEDEILIPLLEKSVDDWPEEYKQLVFGVDF